MCDSHQDFSPKNDWWGHLLSGWQDIAVSHWLCAPPGEQACKSHPSRTAQSLSRSGAVRTFSAARYSEAVAFTWLSLSLVASSFVAGGSWLIWSTSRNGLGTDSDLELLSLPAEQTLDLSWWPPTHATRIRPQKSKGIRSLSGSRSSLVGLGLLLLTLSVCSIPSEAISRICCDLASCCWLCWAPPNLGLGAVLKYHRRSGRPHQQQQQLLQQVKGVCWFRLAFQPSEVAHHLLWTWFRMMAFRPSMMTVQGTWGWDQRTCAVCCRCSTGCSNARGSLWKHQGELDPQRWRCQAGAGRP